MESVVLGAEGGVVGKQDGRADADGQCCVKRKRILFHRPLHMNGSLRGGNSPFGKTETVSVRANDNRGKAGRFGLNAQVHCRQLVERGTAPSVALTSAISRCFAPGGAVQIHHLSPSVHESVGKRVISVAHFQRTEHVVIHGEGTACDIGGIACPIHECAGFVSADCTGQNCPKRGVFAVFSARRGVPEQSLFGVVAVQYGILVDVQGILRKGAVVRLRARSRRLLPVPPHTSGC